MASLLSGRCRLVGTAVSTSLFRAAEGNWLGHICEIPYSWRLFCQYNHSVHFSMLFSWEFFSLACILHVAPFGCFHLQEESQVWENASNPHQRWSSPQRMSTSSVVLVLLAVCLLIVCQLTQTTEFFFSRLGLKTGLGKFICPLH